MWDYFCAIPLWLVYVPLIITYKKNNDPSTNKFKYVVDIKFTPFQTMKIYALSLQVMDMEHELRALRNQIREKSMFSIKLQKEVCLRSCIPLKSYVISFADHS